MTIELLVGFLMLLSLVLLAAAMSTRGSVPAAGPAARRDASPDAAAARRGPVSGEAHLHRRVEELRREAELAERRWAAAVLQERAARIHAERYARELAQARRQAEAQPAAHDIPAVMKVDEALRILRVAPGCTLEEARNAYYRLVARYHPDKVSVFGSQIRETAERETRRINLAYEIVKKSIRKPAV